MHEGLVFKLATDPKIEGRYLYGGETADLSLAAKGARGELHGSNSFFQFFLEKEIPIQVPLQTVIDYRGFRLVAMPVFPIQRGQTLVYGSEDAGATVRNSDSEFEKWMAQAARRFSLARHNVHGKMLYTGGDVEGHRVLDEDGKNQYCERGRMIMTMMMMMMMMMMMLKKQLGTNLWMVILHALEAGK
eukprot:jgi/Bigna1/128723/aug1.7_g3431